MGKKTFGQRRTVVQLNDEERKPAYGFGYTPSEGESGQSKGSLSALGGLMSQYADGEQSSEEEEEEEDNEERKSHQSLVKQTGQTQQGSKHPTYPQFVTAAADVGELKADGKEVAQTATRAADKECTTAVMGKQAAVKATDNGGNTDDDIDSKLRNFLAEIESIDIDIDGVPYEEPSNVPVAQSDSTVDKHVSVLTSGPAENSDSDGGGRCSSDEEKLLKPAPIKPLAPVTSWQHLLDDASQCYYYWNTETNEVTWEIPPGFTKYMLCCKEYEERKVKYARELHDWKKERRRIKKLQKNRKVKTNSGTNAEDKKSTHPPPTVYGPELPAAAATTAASVTSRDSTTSHDVAQSASDAQTRHRVVSYDSDLSSDDGMERIEGYAKKKNKKRNKDNDDDFKVNDKTEVVDVKIEEKTKDNVVRKKEENSLHGQKEMDETMSMDHVEVGNILRGSDGDVTPPPVFTRFEYVNKKYDEMEEEELMGVEGVEEEEGGEGFNVDDIDLELEKALVKQNKAVKTKAAEESLSIPVAGGSSLSSQHLSTTQLSFGADERTMTRLQSDTMMVDGEEDMSWFNLTADDLLHRQSVLAEIGELASTVLDKLEFLDVVRTGLSRLQIVLIQTQTRIQDWKNGFLNTDYFLRTLQEASAMLVRHELALSMSRTCGVWTWQWDRDSKRYFYMNNITGDTSWNYSDTLTEEHGTADETCRMDNTTVSQLYLPPPPASSIYTTLLPPPPPPTPPPPTPPSLNSSPSYSTNPPDLSVNEDTKPRHHISSAILDVGKSAESLLAESTDIFVIAANPPPPPCSPPSGPPPQEDSTETASLEDGELAEEYSDRYQNHAHPPLYVCAFVSPYSSITDRSAPTDFISQSNPMEDEEDEDGASQAYVEDTRQQWDDSEGVVDTTNHDEDPDKIDQQSEHCHNAGEQQVGFHDSEQEQTQREEQQLIANGGQISSDEQRMCDVRTENIKESQQLEGEAMPNNSSCAAEQLQPGSSSCHDDEQQLHCKTKEKRKKKEKVLGIVGSTTTKKRKLSNLVEKWQRVQMDVTKEVHEEEMKRLKSLEPRAADNLSNNH